MSEVLKHTGLVVILFGTLALANSGFCLITPTGSLVPLMNTETRNPLNVVPSNPGLA